MRLPDSAQRTPAAQDVGASTPAENGLAGQTTAAEASSQSVVAGDAFVASHSTGAAASQPPVAARFAHAPSNENTLAPNALLAPVGANPVTSVPLGTAALSAQRTTPPVRTKVEPNTEGFSIHNANVTARLAMYSDADRDTLLQKLYDWGFDPSTLHLFADRETDTQGFAVADATGNIYVSYLGTTSLPDFMTDLSARLVAPEWSSTRELKVHRGFNSDFNGIWRQVERSLNEIRAQVGDKGTIYFTGHSMGGSLAELSALRARRLWYVPAEKIQVYGFGTPRTGNQAFADEYNARIPRTFNVVAQNGRWRDPITTFPMDWMGYRDAGQTVLLDSNGEIHPGGPAESSGAWDWLPTLYLDPGFDIHRMASYLDRVARGAALVDAA